MMIFWVFLFLGRFQESSAEFSGNLKLGLQPVTDGKLGLQPVTKGDCGAQVERTAEREIEHLGSDSIEV